MGHRMRAVLASVPRTATPPAELSPGQLKEGGIEVLALDFDGILSPHGETQPLPFMEDWLDRCLPVFGPGNVFILSNKPVESRISYFRNRFPGIRFIAGERKKPYPDGVLKAAALAGVPVDRVLLIDDRLMTGVLAACIAGSKVIYITKPYADYSRRPFTELFFHLLRLAERLLVYK